MSNNCWYCNQSLELMQRVEGDDLHLDCKNQYLRERYNSKKESNKAIELTNGLQSKICRVCEENKEVSKFHISRILKNDYICKDCISKRNKEKYLKRKV